MEMAFYYIFPGVSGYGKPLRHEGGKQLKYFCNAYLSLYATLAVAAALHITRVYTLYTIIDEFGSIMSVAILSGFINSILVYIAAFARGRTVRLSGYPIYDFFMGAELNPRIGILDLKMFYEVRIPWFILLLISCAVAARQYEDLGYVSGEVLFLVLAHLLYANACAKAEQLIITSWDMYWEKLGFMLTFWNMAGVPFSYCHCALYLANHPPSSDPSQQSFWTRHPLTLVAFVAAYLFVYWVWDTANSQKNAFRQMERGQFVERRTFPQLPWRVVNNPKVITSDKGDTIMADGIFRWARKISYTADMWFALSWGLITGFESPFPWFYPVFFCIMIAHRTQRDITKCRHKYGKAWEQYEKEVPYLFVPYLF
ncbi:Delta24(24(1))-sterol reductase [Microdochium nivale]|nr:Delta24(24(1))-sterol reductase [Microdochium nivale]